MRTSLTNADLETIVAPLRAANEAFARRYPGEGGQRQPVHTVYGGAHLFRADTTVKLGEVARRMVADYAPTPGDLAQAIGLDPSSDHAGAVHARMLEKLEREPVEDFRIDFEDGYGVRRDAEEDGHAVAAATEVATGLERGTLPPFIGIRLKPFNEEMRVRSMRTLDLFVTTLCEKTGGRLPPGFVITLPKVPVPEQVSALADLLERLEPKCGLAPRALNLEIMVELPQTLFDAEGRFHLPILLDAARGRCIAAHFGTYDHTAACGITAEWQHMRHAACDFAKHCMQVAYSGRGIWLSDGATNIMPVPVHRPAEGETLSPTRHAENRAAIHRAWKIHHDDIRHSLVNGYYQGWDLHPGQLPTRYAAVYAFFLESSKAAGERLKNFIDKAAQATLVGDVFDDAATGQGLLNFFLRGIACGAIKEEEALATGLSLEEIRGRSFLKILEGRRGRG